MSKLSRKKGGDMSEMKATTGETFPKKSCLFVPIDGKVDSTWRYLSEKLSEDKRQKMIAQQVAWGMDTMIFLTYGRGGDCDINPFVQTYGPDVDWPKVARWMQRLEPGKHGANLIPCLFCDDDPETARNIAFHDYYVPAACVALGPYSRAICIGLEMNEQFSVAAMEHIIAVCKHYTDKPIGVHLQYRPGMALPKGLDFLIYEFSFHPKDGDKKSVSDIIMEAKTVLAACSLPIWFQEMNMNPEGQRAREQSRALLELSKTEPRIVGLPGPT